MNLEIDGLIEESICNNLEACGIPADVIHKCIEAIKYDLKETNYMHNSVADSNYYGMIERQENEKIKSAQKDLIDAEKKHKERIEEMERNARWQGQRYLQRIEELEKQLK